MKLSAPIFQLKRRAKLMARHGNVPLHEALDLIAREEGFARWSLLASRVSSTSLSERILSILDDGDLLLLAGRPGHGKTTLGLQLLIDAATADRGAFLFTFELTEQQARRHIQHLAKDNHHAAGRVKISTADAISAEYIIQTMSGSEAGTIAICQSAQKVDPISASNVDPHVDDQHLDRPALAGVAEGEPGAGGGALRL